MTRAPDVSVIIPLYNRAHLIEWTLASLHPSSHPEVRLEVIIVDDGSNDGGADRVRASRTPALLLKERHRGAPAARNRGIAAASAPTILLLDSDDLVEPGYFSPKLDALRRHPEAAGAYGCWAGFRGVGSFHESLVVDPVDEYPLDSAVAGRSHLRRLLAGAYIHPAAILWRTEAVRRVGGHTVGLSVNQDVDLLFRIFMEADRVLGCTGARALVRDHDGERVGRWAESVEKVRDMLELRRSFARRLVLERRDDPELLKALGQFCFARWEDLRQTDRGAAEGFMALSRQLYPGLRLGGRWQVRLLSRILGAERASLLRRRFRRPTASTASTSPMLRQADRSLPEPGAGEPDAARWSER